MTGQVAQLVERGPEKAGVGGSNPSLATIPFKNQRKPVTGKVARTIARHQLSDVRLVAEMRGEVLERRVAIRRFVVFSSEFVDRVFLFADITHDPRITRNNTKKWCGTSPLCLSLRS